ncbi:UNVERIFIED_CONTAM: hypothetical protein FKN15_073542 [Acipenser sinensis]
MGRKRKTLNEYCAQYPDRRLKSLRQDEAGLSALPSSDSEFSCAEPEAGERELRVQIISAEEGEKKDGRKKRKGGRKKRKGGRKKRKGEGEAATTTAAAQEVVVPGPQSVWTPGLGG